MTRIGLVVACGLVLLAAAAYAEAKAPFQEIAGRKYSLLVRFAEGVPEGVELVELGCWQEYAPKVEPLGAWEVPAGAKDFTVPRFEGKRDRLFSKFMLVDRKSRKALGPARYVTDLKYAGARSFKLPWPESQKGLSCPVMHEDVLELGVKHVDLNILLTPMFDLHNPNPAAWYELDGERYPLNMRYIEYFDREFKWFTEHNISITLIVLNGVPKEPDPANPFIHPWTDLAQAPAHLGGINVYDERGFKWYRAAIEFLSERYTRLDAKYGLLNGFIVGNELQSHWTWYNLGEHSADEVLDEYYKALRVTWLAARKHHTGLKVYASMDHHWANPGGPPNRAITGLKVLEGLAARSRREGDFDWEVAFHPYPSNLYEPRFWLEKDTPLAFNAEKISFHNLEVLPVFLNRPELKCNGKPRGIILSEQGFNKPKGPDGEKVQAAAYALAWWKVSHIPEIRAFLLFKHVSTRAEGSLRFGLWDYDPKDPAGTAPGKKNLMWDVFKAADTPDWKRAFAFAKPIIGIKSWKQALPAKPSKIDRTLPKYPKVAEGEKLLYSLAYNWQSAQRENCADWRPEALMWDGVLYPAIFHHPPNEGVGRATFTVDLPTATRSYWPVLRFGTALKADSTNGVRFSVLIAGREVWHFEQTDRKLHWHEIGPLDGGRGVKVTLCVDALNDPTNDWALWVWPTFVEHSWLASHLDKDELKPR